MRSILDSSEEETTTVSAEFDRIDNYVSLQQKAVIVMSFFTRNSGTIRAVQIRQDYSPLVENSYKYRECLREEFMDKTFFGSNRGCLVITVEDSGYGFLERITGIGLALVRERISFNRSGSRRPDLWKITTDFGKEKAP